MPVYFPSFCWVFIPPTTEGYLRLSRPGCSVLPRWFTRSKTVTNPGTNRAWRRVTMLIETKVTNSNLLSNSSLFNIRNTFCRTRSLSNATFSFLITWRSSSSKFAAVYKIASKSDDFSLRYGDISIFKMAAVRHLGIVYHHTSPPTKSLLLASAACQISCQSDTQIWRYSYLNFSHIWLEIPPI